MSLIALKTRLQQRRQATLSELALHVGSSTDAVRDALQIWVGKGRVRRIGGGSDAAGKACGSGGCKGCHGPEETYEWVDPVSP